MTFSLLPAAGLRSLGRLVLGLVCCLCWAPLSESAPPNVLVILADDAGWGDFSFVGNTNLATPAIDSLARDGATLSRFFVQPVCAPTRAEFLTGRYHPRSGVRGVSLGLERMAADERTVADMFQSAGYSTGCFGKWHNGTQWPHHPRARGFSTFVGFTEGHWGTYFNPVLEFDGELLRDHGYIADRITDHALTFIDRSCTQAAPAPFFCFVSLNTPHSPLAVPDAEWERFRTRPIPLRGPLGGDENLEFTRAVLAMMENLDHNVGRLLAALNRLEIANDTIVLFFSDNGPNSDRWCGGLRGRKSSTDEGGVRSVCCLRWPGHIPAGREVRQPAGAIDLLPSLASLANVPLPSGKPLDGLNLGPLLTLDQDSAATAQLAAARPLFAAHGGKISVRTADHRLDAEGRLYTIETDPGMTIDRSAAQPEVAATLRALAAGWRAEVLEAAPPRKEERFSVGYPAWPKTELPARDGLPQGGIRRSAKAPNSSYFTDWKRAADAMTWAIDVHSAGRYEACIWYTCPAADAGSTVELVAESAAEGVPAAALSRSRPTRVPAWDPPLNSGEDRVERVGESFEKDFRPLSLGEFNLPAGPCTLRLQATTVAGTSVADVRRIVLTLLEPAAVPAR